MSTTKGIITHNDLDGVGSLYMLSRFNKFDNMQNTAYKDLDRKLKLLTDAQVDVLAITDLSLDQKYIEYIANHFEKPVLFDHHETSNSLVIPFKHTIDLDCCSTLKICKTYHKKVKYTDAELRFAGLVNDYDLFTLKYSKAMLLNNLFFIKGFWGFYDYITENRCEFTESDWAEAQTYQDKKEAEIRAFDFYEFGKTRLTYASGHISDISLTFPEFNYHIIVRSPTVLSFRSKDKSLVPLIESLKEDYPHIDAGSHPYAGGVYLNQEGDTTDMIYNIVEKFCKYTGDYNDS